MELSLIITVLIVLFLFFTALRSVIKTEVCAMCGAVATTWIGLLVMYYSGIETDPRLIGILMGGSVVGLGYLLEEKLPKKYGLYKFPFIVTLFVIAYVLVGGGISFGVFGVLLVMWAFFGFLFGVRENNTFKKIVNHIIECCKNW